MIEQPPILVTGIQRSGTSMIAGVLQICGAFCGKPHNVNKHYENTHIHNQIIAPYLKSIGVDPNGQYPLPNMDSLPIPTDWAAKIRECIKEEGYTGGPWMIKSSKIALLWPIWNYAFPAAKWIIVRRRTGDIIQSCLKTDFMRAFRNVDNQRAVGTRNEEDGWLWWVHQHEKRFVEMITEGVNCKVIWPHRMVYGDYQQMYETIDWLGLKWTTDVLAFIDPRLWKARQHSELGKPVIYPIQSNVAITGDKNP